MMRTKFWRIILVSALALLLLAGLPAESQAQGGAAGENFIFINYIGHEMFLDLDDVTYPIPGTSTAPEGGRLALQLTVGEHKYAANVPGVGGSAGEFTITPGGVVAKAARIEQGAPVLDRDGILLEKPKDEVVVFDFDPFATAVETTPVVDTWQPAAAAPGQASLVFVNYAPDELTVDINGLLYKVAPPTPNIPGRLQVDLPPGDYRYTASIPAGSLNAEITVAAGQVIGLNISADAPPEREYEIGEKYKFILPLTLRLSEEDLTVRANTAVTPAAVVVPAAVAPATTEAAPATLPVSGGSLPETAPAQMPVVTNGLLIKNYAGETLVFTINGQAYNVPNNDQLTISLAPGTYTYTASRPFVATTGTVILLPEQGVELSVAINIAGDVLSVYQN
jgi:hypothetical protein